MTVTPIRDRSTCAVGRASCPYTVIRRRDPRARPALDVGTMVGMTETMRPNRLIFMGSMAVTPSAIGQSTPIQAHLSTPRETGLFPGFRALWHENLSTLVSRQL